jgi:hypothetical protein
VCEALAHFYNTLSCQLSPNSRIRLLPVSCLAAAITRAAALSSIADSPSSPRTSPATSSSSTVLVQWCSRPTPLSPRTSPAGQRLHLRHRPAAVLVAAEGSIAAVLVAVEGSILPFRFHVLFLSSTHPLLLLV